MTQEHPITPPPELVEKWRTAPEYTTGKEMFTMVSVSTRRLQEVATQAARWGADQEFEACCHEVQKLYGVGRWLRSIRRPKPLSLKEQALECLKNIDDACESEGFSRSDDTDIIRRALELLND